MRANDLKKIKKLYFSTDDIATALTISKASARVTASRYTRSDFITRIKRDVYILTNRIPFLSEEEQFQLANLIETPSYISLTSALAYYNLTTQQPRQFVESIALKRKKHVLVGEIEFSYTLIKESMYNGFELNNQFFIARPEKALADCIYLTSLKRYNCDFHGVDFHKIDCQKVRSFLINANKAALNLWEALCKN